MPEFEMKGWIDNLTPPTNPISVSGITVERQPIGHTLDDATARRAAEAAGLSIIQTTELRQAVAIRERMIVQCQMRAMVEAVNEQAVLDALLPRFQKLMMAIQLLTARAVELTGWQIGEPDASMFFPVRYERFYPGGAATITSAHVAVLQEIVDVLAGTFPQRISTALVEFYTALRSEEVRRQCIHAVVVLEALFGDQATEALSYKIPLRAVQLIPSLTKKKEEGFRILREAYRLRSRFVHGTWTEDTLDKALPLIENVLQLAAEALQEFLFRARDGKAVDFPTLDDELFLKNR